MRVLGPAAGQLDQPGFLLCHIHSVAAVGAEPLLDLGLPGLVRVAQKIPTAVLLAVCHPWLDPAASEVLSLLFINRTAGSFSVSTVSSLSPRQSMRGLCPRAEWSWPGFRGMAPGTKEFCLIIALWQQ